METRIVNLQKETVESLPLSFTVNFKVKGRECTAQINDLFKNELLSIDNDGFQFGLDSNGNITITDYDAFCNNTRAMKISSDRNSYQIPYLVGSNDGFYYAIKTDVNTYTLLSAESVLQINELKYFKLGYNISRPMMCPANVNPLGIYYKYKDKYERLSILMDDGQFEHFDNITDDSQYDEIVNRYSVACKIDKKTNDVIMFRIDNSL